MVSVTRRSGVYPIWRVAARVRSGRNLEVLEDFTGSLGSNRAEKSNYHQPYLHGVQVGFTSDECRSNALRGEVKFRLRPQKLASMGAAVRSAWATTPTPITARRPAQYIAQRCVGIVRRRLIWTRDAPRGI